MIIIDKKYLIETPTSLPIKTIFGNAKRNNWGYFIITSSKEGFYLKKLHRLIYENEYNCKLSRDDIIHHKDGDRDNNLIDNLELMTRKQHIQLHKKNIPQTDIHKLRKLNSINKVGIKGLHYVRPYNRKPYWKYIINRKSWSSNDLIKLKKKLLKENIYWEVFDKNKVKKICNEHNYPYEYILSNSKWIN